MFGMGTGVTLLPKSPEYLPASCESGSVETVRGFLVLGFWLGCSWFRLLNQELGTRNQEPVLCGNREIEVKPHGHLVRVS